MEEENKVSLVERAKGFFKEKPITPSNKIDRYITRKLPEYIKEYKLATRSDLQGVDERLDSLDEDMDDLLGWKKETKKRVERSREKIERLEKKHGIKED